MVRFDVGVESFLSQEIPKLFEFDHRLIVELPIGRSPPDIVSHGLPIPYEKLALALLMSESDIYVLPPPHGSTENHFRLLANSSPSYGRPIGPREVWIYNHSTTEHSPDTSPPLVSLFSMYMVMCVHSVMLKSLLKFWYVNLLESVTWSISTCFMYVAVGTSTSIYNVPPQCTWKTGIVSTTN